MHKLPDKATRSVVSRLCTENLDVRISRESGPSGSAVTASPRFAVRPSLLPNNTSHDGPPALNGKIIKIVLLKIFTLGLET